ncbi:MAG: 1-(5-phosphoribosyl)-5-[(5-phosphoribosylamino)methylideneamino]imidazole-4-carboxamide isomerase [Sporocytophaga sp.]|uniref:1-(5-phosphoribosyl)-5-[(5- phosphoribosylamino)methylideneamino]imidazole-4- carboxamide isomerase n=1 Tax=Sporocytophaga sp. TaxID=2231183 RepID=UPI001B224AA0|nr:1-(5-phosphoribosyl)-5-[(5-phosphoribosylamino)methylideneamino]imidazole-4-carboxamide isomerase [Sporocytophaga sp.]MBO9700753.1 1-(5-phosphoribosyl)-5-[(5-phosphoribosylamino)methylideneamino]imidazole-4-carboxamide isomerase [Sporocytophaga sp.]
MIEIIPAIDLIDGKCVRLVQGDFDKKTEYHSNPLEVAKRFEDAGIKRLHVVDLDGARQKKVVNHKVLEEICTNTSLHVDFGGGIQSQEDIKIAFNAGAKQVTGGSIAIKNPELFKSWLKNYGGEKIILGADVKNKMIAVSGWQEVTATSLFDFTGEYSALGAKYLFCTDVSKDGLLAGPSFELYNEIRNKFPKLKLIASGGVTTIEDIAKLNEMGVYAAIIGKAYYEGRIKLEDLKRFL